MKKSLNALILSTALALSSAGCASWPTPVKAVATPIAVARDVVDLPLGTFATLSDYAAEGSRGRFGDTRSGWGYGWSEWGSGIGMGASVDITYPVCKLFSGAFGLTDYIACRSFVGKEEGVSPFKKSSWDWKDYLFPNMHELWSN